MLAEAEGSRWYALFPVKCRQAPDDAAALRDRLFELRKKGFNRLFQDGQTFEFSTPESLLEIDFSKPLYILADRIVIRPDLAPATGRYGRDLLSRNAARSSSSKPA